jgi:geranylgeranyl reductase
MSAGRLKRSLLRWAERQGYQLQDLPCLSALISYDYRGHAFGPVRLVGDAAGFASGLTGEGIYPAVVSGETVARRLIDPGSSEAPIAEMVSKQRLHRLVTDLSMRHASCCFFIMELLILLLRCRLLGFRALELAPSLQKQ